MPKSRRSSAPPLSQPDFARRLGTAAFENARPHPRKLAPIFRVEDKPYRSSVRIRPLQHMVIIHLRRQIAEAAAHLHRTRNASDEDMEQVRKLLRQYTQAVQDWKFMLETPGATPTITKFLQDLMEIQPRRYSASDHADTDHAILVEAGLLGGPPANIHVSDFYGVGGRAHRKNAQKTVFRGLLERIAMALFGGAVVVAPILIMTLHPAPSPLVSLLTTSLFVVVVALALAIVMSDAVPKDILTAIVAYAAILVVFVGTTTASLS